jgi:hypothetical protein
MFEFSLVQQIAMAGAAVTSLVLVVSLATASLYDAVAKARLATAPARRQRQPDMRWMGLTAANDNSARWEADQCRGTPS